MDPDPLMSIGMFSRASLLSVRTLRAYHEQGLLIPAHVDSQTSYRSYRVSQLTDAAVIKRLRDLDVPLKSVHEVVTARDPEITRKVIADHEAVMQQKLAELAQIVVDLQEAVALPSLQTPVHIRDEEPAHAIAVHGLVQDGNYEDFLSPAFEAIWLTVQRLGAVPRGQGTGLYPNHVDVVDEAVIAYVAIEHPVSLDEAAIAAGAKMSMIPAATCAVATHIGDYDTIGETYRQLGAWVAHHATSADLAVREHYVVSIDPSNGTLLPADQLRTEIAWPITRPDPKRNPS